MYDRFMTIRTLSFSLMSFFVFAFLFGGARQTFAATPVSFPPEAVGIDEETFQVLEDINGKGCNPDTSGQTNSCPAIAKELNGDIVFRAEAQGEMYRFQFVGAPGAWDGLLERYLPDNFYKADGKYYWVANGYALEMKKGKAFKKFMRRIGQYEPSYTGVSEEDFSSMLTTCEYYGGDRAPYDACVAKYERGQKIGERLQGKIVMRTQLDGSLYYVQPGGYQLFPIGTKKQIGQSLFSVIKQVAAEVSQEVMAVIPPVIE